MVLKVVTGEQMRQIDRITIEERHVSGLELMERAGKAVADILWEKYKPESVAIICGKGNNAGDGYVAARYLCERGLTVKVIHLSNPDELKGDALNNYLRLPKSALKQEIITSPQRLASAIESCEWIIDAILGTGLKGAATGFLAKSIEVLNECHKPIMAVDIPSGLSADGGKITGPVIRAVETVTMGLPKIGMILSPGIKYTGKVTVADLDFPVDLLTSNNIKTHLLEEGDIADWLPKRPYDGNKGTFGKVLIIAGSPGMTGAAILAARAATRSGIGLVYAGLPEKVLPYIESQIIEPVKIPIHSETGFYFDIKSLGKIQELLEHIDAVALGPGLGTAIETVEFVHLLLPLINKPLVIDADGLNALAQKIDVLKDRQSPTIITPHPGEMSRLMNCSVEEVLDNRLELASNFSKQWNVTVLLKGHHSIIAEPGGMIFINPTGNTGLAKGGSGDVLTGLIAGLLGQGMNSLHASCCGAFIHGVCADIAAKDIPPRCMIPSDIITYIPKAFTQIEKITGNKKTTIC